MSESEQATPGSDVPGSALKLTRSPYSFSIWPPTGKTREAVRNRLIETLSTSSALSKRYSAIAYDEVVAFARRVEEEAFNAVSLEAKCEEREILHLYSKEISKRMLEMMKSRSKKSDHSGSNAAPKSFDLNLPAQAEDHTPAAPSVTNK